MPTATRTQSPTIDDLALKLHGRIFVVDLAKQDGAGDPSELIEKALGLDSKRNLGTATTRRAKRTEFQTPTIHYYDGVERRGQATNGIKLQDIPELSHYLDRGITFLNHLSPLTEQEKGRLQNIFNNEYVKDLIARHPNTWLARLKAKYNQEECRQADNYLDGVIAKITDTAKAKPYAPLLLVVTYHLLDSGNTREKAFRILENLRSFYNIVPVLVGPDTDTEERYAQQMLAQSELNVPYFRNCEGNDLGNALTAKLAEKYVQLRISRLKDAAHKVRDAASKGPYVQIELPFTPPGIEDGVVTELPRRDGAPPLLTLVPVGAGVEGAQTVVGATLEVKDTPDLAYGLAAMRVNT